LCNRGDFRETVILEICHLLCCGFLTNMLNVWRNQPRVKRHHPQDIDDIDYDDLFGKLKLDDNDTVVKRSFMQEHVTLAPFTKGDQGDYRFAIRASPDVGTDLQNCFVEVDLQVFKEDGSPLTDDDEDKIFPANDFFNALFSKVFSLAYII
jgi:hypothetical protein